MWDMQYLTRAPGLSAIMMTGGGPAFLLPAQTYTQRRYQGGEGGVKLTDMINREWGLGNSLPCWLENVNSCKILNHE